MKAYLVSLPDEEVSVPILKEFLKEKSLKYCTMQEESIANMIVSEFARLGIAYSKFDVYEE